jgi:cytochrome c-type biogenesis protein CcmH/NrfG
LGEAYEARREPADAITAYRRSLSIDGGNDHAIAHLKMLVASMAK